MTVRRMPPHEPIVGMRADPSQHRDANRTNVRCQACGRLVMGVLRGVDGWAWRHAIDFTMQGYSRWRVVTDPHNYSTSHFDNGSGKPICGRRRINGGPWVVMDHTGIFHCKRCEKIVEERKLVRTRTISRPSDDFAAVKMGD